MSKKTKIITASIILIIVVVLGVGVLMIKKQDKPEGATLKPKMMNMHPI